MKKMQIFCTYRFSSFSLYSNYFSIVGMCSVGLLSTDYTVIGVTDTLISLAPTSLRTPKIFSQCSLKQWSSVYWPHRHRCSVEHWYTDNFWLAKVVRQLLWHLLEEKYAWERRLHWIRRYDRDNFSILLLRVDYMQSNIFNALIGYIFAIAV